MKINWTFEETDKKKFKNLLDIAWIPISIVEVPVAV